MNGHDFTLEQNTEARMMLAVARRGLAAAINDAENGIGHLSCDDPKIMEQVRAHWRRLYDTYMNADALLSDLESCARHLTDGDKWEPNPIADGMKPMEMAKGCACFTAETPDRVLITPSEPTPGENTAGCWSDANGTLWLITGGDGIDGHIFRLKEEGREWECAPCSGITVRMLHEWGPWARCDFEPMDDEGTHFDWCKPWIADRGWTAEELDDDSGEPAAHGPYTRYSLQTVEEVPWKPVSDDSTPIHEGSRTVHLPDVRSFGRMEQDKWLAVKNLEESAELVEACKQWLKACDPADPNGIDGQFIGVVNCLNIHGAAVGDEPDIDLDKAQADWHDHVRDQRRQAMLGELADVLQTVGNLITAFGITDEEVERAMDDCLERNRRKGRL